MAVGVPVRPEIASSWERAASTGLVPTACPDVETAVEVDPTSRLLQAATPVLDELAGELAGSRYALLLADRDARLIDLRYGRESLRPVLDGVGAIQGQRFTESTTGTNSIATAFELRRGISVHGAEHYLESFKDFACYGMPVFDPVTKRVAGVLDITCPADDANDLLRPFLTRGAQQIESRLLGLARRSHRSVLDAFEAASCRSSDPLVAFGNDLVLANDAATELLEPIDHAALQTVGSDMARLRDGTRRCAMELSSGVRVEVAVVTIDGGFLVRLVAPAEQHAPVPRRTSTRRRGATGAPDWHAGLRPELERCRDERTSVLLTGESGSGRSTAARQLAGAHASVLTGPTATVELVSAAAEAAARGAGALIVEDVDLLAAPAAAHLALMVGSSDGSAVQLVLTALTPAGRAGTGGHSAALVARCPVRLELSPLRARRDRIPALADGLLRSASGGRTRFTVPTLRLLAGLEWPGNLRELTTLVDHVASRRSAGDASEADLPPGYRGAGRPQVTGALWQAERDAVVHALRACRGNKLHAAEMLGISRTTLYRRLRVLHIDPDSLRDRRAVTDVDS